MSTVADESEREAAEARGDLTPSWFTPDRHPEFEHWLSLQDNVTHSRPLVDLISLWGKDEAWKARGPGRPYLSRA